MSCEEYACATQVKHNRIKSFQKEHSHFSYANMPFLTIVFEPWNYYIAMYFKHGKYNIQHRDVTTGKI